MHRHNSMTRITIFVPLNFHLKTPISSTFFLETLSADIQYFLNGNDHTEDRSLIWKRRSAVALYRELKFGQQPSFEPIFYEVRSSFGRVTPLGSVPGLGGEK